jgi:hypothetical protein
MRKVREGAEGHNASTKCAIVSVMLIFLRKGEGESREEQCLN